MIGIYEVVRTPDGDVSSVLDKPITTYFQKELENLAEKKKVRSARKMFGRLVDRTRKSLEEVSEQPLDEIRARSRQLISQLYDRLGSDADVLTASREWRKECFLLGVFADCLEEQDQVIVDAGCGTGMDLVSLGLQFPSKEFIGYDLSRRQVQLAKERVQRAGIRNVKFYHIPEGKLADELGENFADLVYVKSRDWEEIYLSSEVSLRRFADPWSQSKIVKKRYEDVDAILKPRGSIVEFGTISKPSQIKIPGFRSTGILYVPDDDGSYYAIASFEKMD